MIAAIYARKSTDQTAVADEQKSVTRQIAHGRDYAVSKGWTIDETCVFVDDGISGAEFAARPGFVRLMNALKPRPPFQVLIMSEESRLGREAIETAYALKQIVTAGVRVFFYLENRERTLESPTDKIMLSLTAFADELEREKARQRVYDAMQRKAKAGHVCGGATFGYTNVEILGPSGERSHVERRIDEAQAAVIRELFELYASGFGVRAIAKHLNEAGRLCPRAQQGRPHGWAPSSVWAALRRPLYRGEIVWNQTRKRNAWGQRAPTSRPAADVMRIAAPTLRIVDEPLWRAVEARAVAVKASYVKAAGGTFGRPADAKESRHLLTGFMRCGHCGANMLVKSRKHGGRHLFYYACSSYHRRGHTVCPNSLAVRVDQADDAILGEIEQFVLNPHVVQRAIELTVEMYRGAGNDRADERARLELERRKAETESGHLTAAIAAGADLQPILAALRAAEQRRRDLAETIDSLNHTAVPFTSQTAAELERQVLAKLSTWRATMRQDAPEARRVLRQVIAERLALTPTERDGKCTYRFRGIFSFGGLFEGLIECPRSMASPEGTAQVWTVEREGLLAA